MQEMPIENPFDFPVPATIDDLRSAIDGIDSDIAIALARRSFFVRHSVRFKKQFDDHATIARRREIVARAVAQAKPLGAPAAIVANVFETMLLQFRDLQLETQRQWADRDAPA